MEHRSLLTSTTDATKKTSALDPRLMKLFKSIKKRTKKLAKLEKERRAEEQRRLEEQRKEQEEKKSFMKKLSEVVLKAIPVIVTGLTALFGFLFKRRPASRDNDTQVLANAIKQALKS